MFPENEAITFAQIGTTSDCDVLSLSDDGLEHLLRQEAPLTKPVLVKETHKGDYTMKIS